MFAISEIFAIGHFCGRVGFHAKEDAYVYGSGSCANGYTATLRFKENHIELTTREWGFDEYADREFDNSRTYTFYRMVDLMQWLRLHNFKTPEEREAEDEARRKEMLRKRQLYMQTGRRE